MNTSMACHVKGCCSQAVAAELWNGVVLNLCAGHNPPNEDDMIDMARAVAEHNATLETMANAFGVK